MGFEAQVFDLSRHLHLRNRVGPGKRRPERLLVVTPQVALDVHAPCDVIAGVVAQSAQRNLELRFPSTRADLGTHRPHCVPVDVDSGSATPLRAARSSGASCARWTASAAASLSSFGYLSIVFDASRTRPKDKTILLVIESVEEDLYRISVLQARITTVLSDYNIVRLAIQTDHTQIEIVVVESNADLGLFCGWLAVIGLLLDKARGRLHFCPNWLDYQAVYLRWSIDAIGAHRWTSPSINVRLPVLKLIFGPRCQDQRNCQ